MTYLTDIRRTAPFLAALLLAAGATRCGGNAQPTSSKEPPGGFRLGTYDDCSAATVLTVPGGGGGLGATGSITLAQSGSVLTASYGGDGGALDASFQFGQTSAASATLLPGQQVGGIEVPCAPLENTPSVAQLESGSLTYNAGTLFLSVEGHDEGADAGKGCSNAGGKAAVLIMCRDDADADAGPPSGGVDAGAGAATLGSGFVGAYTCVSSVENTKSSGSSGRYDSASSNSTGPLGTLTITETGGVLTAAYTNDDFVEGTMQFVPTTRSAAVPATPDETMQVVCNNPYDIMPNPSASALPVASGTLTIDGSSVVLSFTGDMTPSSTCPGAETFVSLLCSK